MGVQHARRASEKEKRNDKRMVETVNENEEERNDGKEYMRALSGRGPTHRDRV